MILQNGRFVHAMVLHRFRCVCLGPGEMLLHEDLQSLYNVDSEHSELHLVLNSRNRELW